MSVFWKAPNSWGFSSSRNQAYLQLAAEKKLAQSKVWLRLGHYQKSLLGTWKSTLRGDFFLAADGNQNPEAELRETIQQFFNPDPQIQQVQCRYLARRQWLLQTLPVEPGDLLPCEEKIQWKKELDATGISFIFASADASSASSIYGHTFLKILGRGKNQQRDLLNYGVNYAAMATDKEGLFYALKGLFGFYKGGFTMLPYHEKLREYVNADGRDIWEYQLDLTPQEVDQMINHLMELGDSWNPYYFAWDNCSYQLLWLLEVAREDLDLTSQFRYVVIPLDTIKVVTRVPGLVKKKRLRRSLKKDFQENYTQLNSAQKKALKSNLDNGIPLQLQEFPPSDQAAILDTALKFYELKTYQEGAHYETKKYELLSTRARLRVPPADSAPETEDSPDLSHDSAGVYFGGGQSGNQGFYSLKLRAAFHDLVSPDESLFEFSHNEALGLDFRYHPNQSRFDLHRFTIFEILTSRPIYELEQPLSWRIKVFTEPKLEPRAEVGFGYSYDFSIKGKIRAIALLAAEAQREGLSAGPDLFLLHKKKGLYSALFNHKGLWTNRGYQQHWNAQIGIPLQTQTELRFELLKEHTKSTEWQIRLLKQFIL